MSKWFMLNLILLSIVIIKVASRDYFPTIDLPIAFGLIGFLFFLFNWTRNAVFSTIRNINNRQKKIKLASISKKIMPLHRWTGTAALLFIIIHVSLIVHWYGFLWQNPKMIFGFFAFINLILMVITGWWRLIRPTGRLRRVHLGLGISLFLLITLHVLL